MNYQRIYTDIIERAQNRSLDCYVERHHIKPRCMKGKKHRLGKKHTDETRKKLSASLKGKMKGVNNYLFRGWYHTPAGRFATSYEAAGKNGVSHMSIQNWCRQNKPGYSFEPVQK